MRKHSIPWKLKNTGIYSDDIETQGKKILLNHMAQLKIYQTPVKSQRTTTKGINFEAAFAGAEHRAGSEGEVLEATPTGGLGMQYFQEAPT